MAHRISDAAPTARAPALLARESESVKKFFGPGGIPPQPGEIPAEGTPETTTTGRAAPGKVPARSALPPIAASRRIARSAEEWTALSGAHLIVDPPYDPFLLVCMVEESDTLPQMIDIMATNISGFGVDLRPLYPRTDADGKPVKPPPEAEEEEEQIRLFLATANPVHGFCGVLDLVDRDVETTGNGYAEVLRDRTGRVAAIEHIPAYTLRLGRIYDPVLVSVPYRNPKSGKLESVQRWRRFRTFCQIIDARVVWFKEYGDPYHVNLQNGERREEPWGTAKEGGSLEASEIIHRKIYAPHSPYGVPRWVGASPTIQSGRSASETLALYFRDAPIGMKLAMIAGGVFRPDSLKRVMDSIDNAARGVEKAFRIVALEADAGSGGEGLDDGTRDTAPRLVFEDLAFEPPADWYKEGGLIERAGRRIAAMFRLPPVYWGGSDDYSRAAVRSAVAATEEQLFEPLRHLRWEQWFNAELLPSMGVNFWELRLKGAATTDDAELLTGLSAIVEGGGASPNALIALLAGLTREELTPIAEPWGDRPIALTLALLAQGKDPNAPLSPAEGADEAAPTAAPAQPGAIDAAVRLLQEVGAGALTKPAAIRLLVAFLGLDETTAAAVVESVEEGAQPAAAPAAPSEPGQPIPTLTGPQREAVQKRLEGSRRVVSQLQKLRASIQEATAEGDKWGV